MRIRNFEIFEQQAKLCSMMANAKRLAIVEILQRGEASVGDIASALGCTISTASQHLRLMRDKQVVVARKDALALGVMSGDLDYPHMDFVGVGTFVDMFSKSKQCWFM